MMVLIVVVTLGVSVAMAGAWLLQRLTRNAGWVDVVWTFATGAAGVAYALLARPGGPGVRQVVLAVLIAAWSLRLGLHIAARTRGRPEDTRYANFRAEWGAGFERRMFWFLQIQAVAAAFLGLSMLLAAANPRTGLGPGGVAGVVVLVIAVRWGGHRGCTTASVPFRSGQSWACVRHRAVGLVTASELFLRVGGLAGVSAVRD